MSDLTKGKAAICIVNYKTLDFTRLCLRSIRKFTEYPYEIIVVDNNSRDESLEYLKSLKWIRLIERDTFRRPARRLLPRSGAGRRPGELLYGIFCLDAFGCVHSKK